MISFRSFLKEVTLLKGREAMRRRAQAVASGEVKDTRRERFQDPKPKGQQSERPDENLLFKMFRSAPADRFRDMDVEASRRPQLNLGSPAAWKTNPKVPLSNRRRLEYLFRMMHLRNTPDLEPKPKAQPLPMRPHVSQ